VQQDAYNCVVYLHDSLTISTRPVRKLGVDARRTSQSFYRTTSNMLSVLSPPSITQPWSAQPTTYRPHSMAYCVHQYRDQYPYKSLFPVRLAPYLQTYLPNCLVLSYLITKDFRLAQPLYLPDRSPKSFDGKHIQPTIISR
jgi:hypothetical protein